MGLAGIPIPVVKGISLQPDTFQYAPLDTLKGSDTNEHFRAQYIEAIRQRHLGNDDNVLALLDRCRTIKHRAAEIYYLYYDYYAQHQDDSLALANIKRAVDAAPDNTKYLQSLTSSLFKNKQYVDAVPILEQLCRNNPSDVESLQALYSVYEYLENNDSALSTLRKIELVDGTSLDVTLAKMNILASQGKSEEEFNEMLQLIGDHPYDNSYRTLAGNWLMGHRRTTEALQYYTSVLEDDPDNEDALIALVDYYEEVGDKQRADSVREQIIFSRKISNDTRLKLVNQRVIRDIQNGVDSTATLAYLQNLVATDPANVDLITNMAYYVDYVKMGKSVLQPMVERILQLKPTDVWARIISMQHLWEDKKYNDVERLATEGTQYVPEEMAFYYFLGLARYNLDDHDGALDALQRGTSQINANSNPAFVSDFYAIMGDIYHEKKLDIRAFEAYDSCLNWQADNVGCLNNYAYYLCQQGQNLDKAEAMSRKTVEAEPDNPTFLDTYAWVLFCMQRYQEAIPYMEHALEVLDGEQAIYLEHAGDIYSMTSQTDKAVDFWKKALELNADDKILKKKIKRRQYIAP